MPPQQPNQFTPDDSNTQVQPNNNQPYVAQLPPSDNLQSLQGTPAAVPAPSQAVNSGTPPATTLGPVAAQSQPVSVERVSLTDLSSFRPRADAATPVNASQDLVNKENVYTEICSQIVKEQEQIIGSLAVEQAQQVEGLTIDPVTYRCSVTGDGSKVIDELIEQYRDFFGHAAVEVCKEAAAKFLSKLPTDELPASLRA